jgi:hypothetical protein
MNAQHKTIFSIGMLAPLLAFAAPGQPSGAPRAVPRVAATLAAPTVTILSASTGAMVRSQGAGNAALDLGRVSYFRGVSAPGERSQKTSGSFVVSTRFALRVDCPGSPSSSQVNVSMSWTDAGESYAMTIDGMILGPTARPLAQSIPCGSTTEHRLDVEVPVSTPAGPIGSTVAFEATLRK